MGIWNGVIVAPRRAMTGLCLYRNHGTFVSAWRTATKSAQRAGFLVDADAREITSAAVHSDIAK